MKTYKSPVNRLVHLFKKGRDIWKKRAVEKQKRIKALEIKVRDLSSSRDHWKEKARLAEKKLHQIEQIHIESQKKMTKNDESNIVQVGEFIPVDKSSILCPARHRHPVFVIQLAIEQFIVSLNSLRGCQSNFNLWANFFSLPTPSFLSLRNWLLLSFPLSIAKTISFLL